MPQDGESLADLAGPELMAGLEQAAQAYGDGWRLPHNPPDADRRTDFMLQIVKQPLAINNIQVDMGLSRWYTALDCPCAITGIL